MITTPIAKQARTRPTYHFGDGGAFFGGGGVYLLRFDFETGTGLTIAGPRMREDEPDR